MYVYEKSSFKPQPQLWTALCYKADESADESKKWALVKRLKVK
jgi:hypothetical protein